MTILVIVLRPDSVRIFPRRGWPPPTPPKGSFCFSFFFNKYREKEEGWFGVWYVGMCVACLLLLCVVVVDVGGVGLKRLPTIACACVCCGC